MSSPVPLPARRRPGPAWAAAWLALCLVLAQSLGLVHRIGHTPGWAAPQSDRVVASAHVHGHGHSVAESGRSVWSSLFGLHNPADCRLYDQSTQADACGWNLPVLHFAQPAEPVATALPMLRWGDRPRFFDARAPPPV